VLSSNLLSKVPIAWDETKFVDTYTGKYIVLVRRKDNQWYIVGINGTKTENNLNLDILFIYRSAKCQKFAYGDNEHSFRIENKCIDSSQPLKNSLKVNDGFLIRVSGN
jgi:hypothetical protein